MFLQCVFSLSVDEEEVLFRHWCGVTMFDGLALVRLASHVEPRRPRR